MPPLLDRVLDQISEKSNPVRDIHYLCVAASIPVDRTSAQCEKIAQALIELEPKIAARKLNQDRNWDDRVGEMYKQLVALDGDLPAQVVAEKHFGRPGHVLFLSEISPELLKPATDAFVHNIQADPHFKWTNGVVFLLGESTVPEHRALIRNKYGDYPLRGAIVMALAQKPEESDRPKFIEGLESAQLEVVDACLSALEKLPAEPIGGGASRAGECPAPLGERQTGTDSARAGRPPLEAEHERRFRLRRRRGGSQASA